MIVVNGTIQTDEANIERLKAAIATMEAASLAEEGCHDYTFSIELNNPDTLRITERWDSMQALESHFKTPHMAIFQAELARHPPGSSKVYFFEATEVTRPGN